MHTKSSINIKPVSGNSEAHNLRTGKPLSYVRSDLTEKNTTWYSESINDARARIEDTYKAAVGQKMQAKATPIREGVVNLGKGQNLETLSNMCHKLKERFGIKPLQIHIHEDEGHHRVKSGEWKQNRHAHIVFDWTNEQGKSIKLNKADMAEMQTIVATALNMKRGQSSDRKHIHAMAYKVQEMEKDALQLEKELKELKANIKAQKYGENIKKGLSESFKAIGGVNTASKLKKELKTLNNDFLGLRDNYAALQDEAKRLRIQDQEARRIITLKTQSEQKVIREKALAEQANRSLTADNQKLQRTLSETEKKLSISLQNEKAWQHNFKMVAKGEISIDKARKFLVENGLIQDRGKSRGMSI